ncbi:peptidoglycan hydrolase-like protein with peptidoglycan-binding domain [Lewinella marina]|uniref:SPOR domain-containing protein n=1 Tax=Neolewinella marina TaxID=438751 RepID=UPI000C04F585|nr:SPOR domain-containing protein [Neolewinella marina]NJB84619.1 peptidoglycan hydrolase-like protein with peptidoglycan-binding domain [Neolewinella marina]
MQRLLLLLLLPLLSAAVTAQSLYHVRVGTFQDVKADDFIDLRELGFVYGQPREGQLTDVYLGNYTTRENAESISEQLRKRGFRNAAVAELPPANAAAGPSTFIQVALRSRNRSLDWRSLEQAGKLYVDATDGVTKVLTGPYPTSEAANQALSDIRGLGYGDAFIRSVAAAQLIPVGTFETGIKKPLIPIQLRQVSSPAAPASSAPSTAGTTPPAPPAADTTRRLTKASAEAEKPAPTPPASAAKEPMGGGVPATATPSVPAIDGKTKRHSTANLQRVLKENKFYEGSIDGYYGTGTTAAFTKAWEEMPVLRKYRLLAENLVTDKVTPDWPELRLTTTITGEIAAGQTDASAASEAAKGRAELLAAQRPLPAARAAQARSWETTVWKNLEKWAGEDPLHARIVNALRVGYYQSQVRLETMYQQRGLGPIEARDLATAALENLLAADLQRFR